LDSLRNILKARRKVAAEVAFQNSLAELPLVTYQAGETVIVDGSTSGRLLIRKKGNVAIVKEDTKIAKVAEAWRRIWELSVLLNQPHTADVRALETSQFHIANATTLFEQNPMAVLYSASAGSRGPATNSLTTDARTPLSAAVVWSKKSESVRGLPETRALANLQ
jgi:hypothetical protein